MQMIRGRNVHQLYFRVIDHLLPVCSRPLKLKAASGLICQCRIDIDKHLQFRFERYVEESSDRTVSICVTTPHEA